MTVARHSESRRLRKQLVFRLTDGLAADVEQLAEQRGCSVATLLREGRPSGPRRGEGHSLWKRRRRPHQGRLRRCSTRHGRAECLVSSLAQQAVTRC